MYYNEKTKKEYAGKNVEILQATGLTGGFVTFRQAIEIGYVVPKGTKALPLVLLSTPLNLYWFTVAIILKRKLSLLSPVLTVLEM